MTKDEFQTLLSSKFPPVLAAEIMDMYDSMSQDKIDHLIRVLQMSPKELKKERRSVADKLNKKVSSLDKRITKLKHLEHQLKKK